MSDASFLSKLLMGLSIFLLIVSFLLLPGTLAKHDNEDIQMASLRDTLDRDGMALPSPTRFSLSFTDHTLLRVIIFLILVAAGLAGEFYMKSWKAGGVLHLVNVLIAIAIGFYFSLSLVLPFVPL